MNALINKQFKAMCYVYPYKVNKLNCLPPSKQRHIDVAELKIPCLDLQASVG
jgi:hypothetical protein